MKIQVIEIDTPYQSYPTNTIQPHWVNRFFAVSKRSRDKYGKQVKAFCACDYCLDDNHVVLFGFDVPINGAIKRLVRLLRLNKL